MVVASAGEDAYELAGQILARLEAGGRTVAVAESLTGGLVAAALTDIPGASASFRGGVVTYATELKASLLGVDRGMLARHGAAVARSLGMPADALAVADELTVSETPPRSSSPSTGASSDASCASVTATSIASTSANVSRCAQSTCRDRVWATTSFCRT